MLKNIIAAFAALALLPSVGLAATTSLSKSSEKTFTYTIRAKDTARTTLLSTNGATECSYVAQISGGATLTLTGDAAEAVSASGSGTIATTGGEFSAQFDTVSVSNVIVTCAPGGSGGGSGASTPAELTPSIQPADPRGENGGGLHYEVDLPNTDVNYGWDSSFGTNAPDAQFDEVNNLMGPFYNKESVNKTCTGNQFEHSFDLSWETAYNYSATDFEPWVEHNWDVWAPLNDVTVTSPSAGWSPVADQYLTFSGTGDNDGKVTAVSGADFTYRQNRGSLAVSATVTDRSYANILVSDGGGIFNPSPGDIITFNNEPGTRGVVVSWQDGVGNVNGGVLVWKRGSIAEPDTAGLLAVTAGAGQSGFLGSGTVVSNNTATVDTITDQCLATGNHWRPYLAVWDVVDNEVNYTWQTEPGNDQRNSFKVANGGIAIGANTSPNGLAGPRLLVEGTQGSSGQASIRFESETGSTHTSPRVLDVFIDSSAASSVVEGSTRGIYVDTTNSGGASNVDGSLQGIHIADMHKGTEQGTSSASIFIAAQTPNAGNISSQHGNFVMAGGNWDDGHIVLGAGAGSHIWFNDTDDVFHISTVADNGTRPISETDGAQVLTGRPHTTNPPAGKPAGYMWFNDNDAVGFYCFRTKTGTDVRLHDPATSCY